MIQAFLKSFETSRLHVYVACGLFLATVLVLRGFAQIDRAVASPLQAQLQAFPRQVGAWKGVADLEMKSDVLAVLGLDDWVMRQYRKETGDAVLFYIGYLGAWDRTKKRQTVHSPQFCYTGGGWEIVRKEVQEVDVPGRGGIPVTRMLVQRGQEKQWVLYWFHWGDRIVAENNVWDYGAKLSWMIQLPFNLIQNKRTDRALVRITTPVVNSVEETLDREIEFVQAVFPFVSDYFSLEVSSL